MLALLDGKRCNYQCSHDPLSVSNKIKLPNFEVEFYPKKELLKRPTNIKQIHLIGFSISGIICIFITSDYEFSHWQNVRAKLKFSEKTGLALDRYWAQKRPSMRGPR